ncbi:hypothetical protein [Streptomyces sp. NPDC057302]|uniref:hypothetical protein n=1 Tax=Streptomyces sp. NPDC057302 TaxID=3346094 RepID=UPI0036421A60
MRKHQRGGTLPERTRPTDIDSVQFRDGMVVTAEDLDTAQRYAASLLKTVLRAYFGCGVVCGLDLRLKKPAGGRPATVLVVDRGVAIDCHGYPLELCKPVELDLGPDACGYAAPSDEIFILLRRATSQEKPCDCATEDEHSACRRVREHVMVKAVSPDELNALPGDICRASEERDDCCGCEGGKCWILLGSIELDDKGFCKTDKDPNLDDRAWVNPLRAPAPSSPSAPAAPAPAPAPAKE